MTGPTPPEPPVERPLALVLAAAFAVFLHINLLIPVLPLYVEELGGGSFLAGLSTTVLMLTTVVAQVFTPRLLNRRGHGATLLVGLLLLGLPTVLYPWATSTWSALVVTLPRGAGFGILTVAFAAFVVAAVPARRRGEWIGLYGVASTLPSVIGLPLGVWMVANASFGAVFFVGILAPPIGFLCVLGARVRSPGPPENVPSFVTSLGRGALLRPFLAFISTTVAAGVLVTFLPLVAPEAGPGSATAALLVWGLIQTFARLWSGRFSDRFGAYRLLVPGLLLSGMGMFLVGRTESAVLLLLGVTLNGFGFGVLQNATMSVLVERVRRAEYGLVSTLWNVGFDAGAGIGPLAFGALVAWTGFATTAAVAALPILAAVGLILLDGMKAPEPD